MTAQELLIYLIRGFADKSLTNDTVITVEDKDGKVDFILGTYTDTISDELYLLLKARINPRFIYILHY